MGVRNRLNDAVASYRSRPVIGQILSNTGWFLFDRVFRLGVGLLVGVWIARYLGPEQFGRWNFAIAFVALFIAISNLGLESILIRELIRNKYDKNVLMGTSFVLKFIGGILTVLLACSIARFDHKIDNHLLVIILITAAATVLQAFDVIDYYFQSLAKGKVAVYAKSIAFFVTSSLKVLFVLMGFKLMAFVWLTFSELFIAAVFMIIFYKGVREKLSEWKFSLPVAKQLMKEGWPLALSSIVIMIYMRIDQFMLGAMVGEKQVGIYSAAVRISEAFFFIPPAISASFFPILIKKMEGDGTDKAKSFRKIQSVQGFILLVLAFSISIFTYLFSDLIIGILFGKAYAGSADAIKYLIWAAIPAFWGGVWTTWLISINKQYIIMIFQVLSMLINVTLNFILIPRYGYIGASIATLISYVGGQLLSLTAYKPKESFGLLFNSIYPFRLK